MSKNIKGVIPKWRFESFDRYPKWDIKKFGCLMEPINERAGDKKYVLMSVTSGVGLIPQVEKFGREIAGNSYKNYYVIRKNDFAYNKSSTKEFPEGYISMLKKYEEAAIPNSIFTCFRVIDDEYEPIFFEQFFNTNYHGKWLRKYIEIGARAHGALSIDTKHLWNMPIAVPKLLEQKKIADCLSSIDDLISAEEKKLSLLNDYKKGWMQKLFPAEGKTFPEWKFPEFGDNDEWMEKKLGEIGEPLMCKRVFKEQTSKDSKNGVPFYKIGTFENEADSFIPIEIYEEYKNKYSFPKSGDILISASGTIGRSVVYNGSPAYFQDTNIVWIDNNERQIINQFLYYCYSNLKWQTSDGGTVRRLYNSNLKNMVISYPKNIKEQKKIANFLSGINDLINRQTDKIEALNQHKKALMQGLFPSIEEVCK